MNSVKSQMAVLSRGCVDISHGELTERLALGRPLRVKAGFDPTAPDLHLGHTVLIQKLRQFQELGHTVVYLIGDFTAMLGDPTGRNELRPRLTREQVRDAAQTYQDQVFKILDRNRTEVRYNSEWLDKMGPTEMIELCSKFTVARMLERDDFAKRFKSNVPIHMHEFLYPLLQGYDSVALDCDIEVGGTDQLFNLLVGRNLMPRYGKPAQMVMTMPLLEGTNAHVEDGKIVGPKMSKTAKNHIGINESPDSMLQKLMLVDDGVIGRYIELLSSRVTEVPLTNIVEIKEAFAKEIVTRFHSAEAAEAALQARRARPSWFAWAQKTGGLPDSR